ncbi:MAG: hypothetical protein IKQ17_02060 [Kiritimatiellae bacterium]|nr:hypothetical protein [Kiritimatiellia bacterium]
MPLQNINTNINNVSLYYFLRGVDAVKQQKAAPAQVQGDASGATGAQQELAAAGEMAAKLDVLLMKAAQASTKSLDGKTVKSTLKQLVNDGALDKNSLKLLAITADVAAKTLKALDKFTGSQLAASFNQDGIIDPNTKTGKALLAAIKAQQDLSDLFSQLGKSLGAMSRHQAEMKGANPGFKGVDPKLLDAVFDMQLLCDRRGTEINHLARQMREFALYQTADGNIPDPGIAAILKAKVNELLPRQALAMHGTTDALSTVSKEVAGKLRPVAEKIDAFRNNPSASLDSNAYKALQSDIATMKAALEDIRTNGIETGDGRMMVAKDIVKALEEEVGKAEDMFKSAKRAVLEKVFDNYMTTMESLLYADESEEIHQASDDLKQAELLILRNTVMNDMKDAAKLVLDAMDKADAPDEKTGDKSADAPGPKELEARINGIIKNAISLTRKANEVELSPSPSRQNYNAMVRRLRGASSAVAGFFKAVSNVYKGDKEFFTGAEAMGVFNGTISVSSIVETRARGLEDSDVDPANEDANITGERKLGQGGAGTVYELTRSDGVKVVFKGETESRTGLADLAVGSGHSYDLGQETVNLNIAAKNAAKALGMGDLIVDYSVGTHKGVFGFYMEKAKGMTACSFVQGKSSSSPDAGMSAADLKRLPSSGQQKVKAGIMRELNRLQWLDLVTGQADRHWNNYFIHVDRKTLKVTVKGIDNDAGYSQYRTGAMKFEFDAKKSKDVRILLNELAQKIDSRNAKAEYERLLKDPGITVGEKGLITIDTTKIANKAMVKAFADITGMQTLAIPDKIDRETYQTLVDLKEGPKRDAYLASIKPRLSKASYKAAVRRLDDVIAHAEALASKGGIVEPDGWANVEMAPKGTGKVNVTSLAGREVRLGGEIAKETNERYCPSIFVRDGIDKLFA